jgi:hypothetical protein
MQPREKANGPNIVDDIEVDDINLTHEEFDSLFAPTQPSQPTEFMESAFDSKLFLD